jgi:regulatory protein RepA
MHSIKLLAVGAEPPGLPPDDAWTLETAAEMEANPPPIPPVLIDGMLYQGGTMMMSGASKSMKTFTMLDAALAVTTGGEWLGFNCTAVPVVFVNLELQRFSMHSRAKAVAAARGIPMPANLHFLNLRGKLVDIDALEMNLTRLVEKTRAGLVIIDPHYKISSASKVEENSNDAQGLLLYRMENAVCQSGAALMVAHHFSKGDKSNTKAIDRAAGGGALARWPDVVMTLTEHEQPECASAEFSLRNFAPISPFVLRWRYPAWTRDGSLNPASLKKAGRNNEHPASELLSFLKDGMSNKEWREASGWAETTYRTKREELITANKVRPTAGLYYHVPPQSP